MTKIWLSVLFLIGLLLVSFNQKILDLFNKSSTLDINPTRIQVAQLTDARGEAEVRIQKQTNWHPISGLTGPLYHEDTLRTGPNSWIELEFMNGLKVRLLPETEVFLEKPDKVIVTFLKGQYEMLNPTENMGQVIFSIQGNVFDPLGRNPSTPLMVGSSKITTKPSPPLPKPVNPEPEEEPNLSNDTIEQVIVAQKNFFNKCYSIHLKDFPNSQGQIHVLFTVQNSGKVSGERIVHSTIADNQLKDCVLEGFRRLNFKSFEGNPVVVNYPIYFE